MAETVAGIGYSEEVDSFEAGRAAASQALERSSGGGGSLALAFVTGRHDPAACFEGLRSVLGTAPVVGGAAAGVITADRLGVEGCQVGVALLPSGLECHLAGAGGLDRGEEQAGKALGQALARTSAGRDKLGLLFYETVRQAPPPYPEINVSSRLLSGFRSGLCRQPSILAGAGLLGGFAMQPGFQYLGDRTGGQSAVGVMLDGDFEPYTMIMHGCRPLSDYHTITRVEGPVVYEIDRRPALEVVRELLGAREWEGHLPLINITLGVNLGEKYAPFDEKKYLNRLIVGYLPEQQAIVLFEADFANGTEFRFMRRNEEQMLASAEKGCRDTRAWLEQHALEPFFALYIDCAGRSSAYCGAKKEEAEIVQRAIGRDIPLLGFYSGVEIAPFMGHSHGLDWTGVLLLLSRKK